MMMAAAHSTSKARSGRNPLLKSSGMPKPTNRSKPPAKRRKTHPVEAAKGPAAPGRPGSQVAERGARIRVRGRLQEMIQAELRNLGRAESVLRCLALSMDYEPLLESQVPYYPDVVEVVGDLVQRSLVDLDALHDGYIPNPLKVARIEQ
jgi:hypothetical protein